MARKRKRRDDDEDDDVDATDVVDDVPADPRKAKPRNDAYVGMLAITFLALVAAGGLFYADFDSLSGQVIAPPAVTVPPLGGTTAP